MKKFIILYGIQGSGKSYISKKIKDYYTNNTKERIIILSKDDYRYTKDGYIFQDEYEKIVEKRYLENLEKKIGEEYDIYILDNTHYNKIFNEKTKNIIKEKTENKYKICNLCIYPSKNLKWHAEQNKHGLNKEDILDRYNKFMRWYKDIKEDEYMIYKIDDEGRFFNDKEIYEIIIKIREELERLM